MALQKQVNLACAPGVPGEKATPDQSIYTPVNPIASVALPVGVFVFASESGDTVDNTHATNVAGTATRVLGFVERDINHINEDASTSGTLTLPKGSQLTVAVKGDYWAVSEDVARVGDTVWATKAAGKLRLGKSDPTTNQAIPTGWLVKTPAVAHEPFIISNW